MTTLNDLTPDADGNIIINGNIWRAMYWDALSIRQLVREVPAGTARLEGQNFLTISSKTHPFNTCIKLDSVEAADAAAQVFEWEITEHASHAWIVVRDSESHKEWQASLAPHDTAAITLDKGRGTYSASRTITPREGETFEIRHHRHNPYNARMTVGGTQYNTHVGTDISIKRFEEASAFALTLPAYVAALASNQSVSTAKEKQ